MPIQLRDVLEQFAELTGVDYEGTTPELELLEALMNKLMDLTTIAAKLAKVEAVMNGTDEDA